MARHRFYHSEPRFLREQLQSVFEQADEVHKQEQELIDQLCYIDESRFYVWAGYNSLRGFCNKGLRFTRTQSQRIATQVRRKRWNQV